MVIYFEPNFDPTGMTSEQVEDAVNRQLGLKPRRPSGDSTVNPQPREEASMDGIDNFVEEEDVD